LLNEITETVIEKLVLIGALIACGLSFIFEASFDIIRFNADFRWIGNFSLLANDGICG
jgi:hypothetical protein